jgi:hypothetical protein
MGPLSLSTTRLGETYSELPRIGAAPRLLDLRPVALDLRRGHEPVRADLVGTESPAPDLGSQGRMADAEEFRRLGKSDRPRVLVYTR